MTGVQTCALPLCIQLVTKVKNNMKNSLMSIADKILLRKRALIETVNDELKNIEQREKSLPLIRITPIQRKAKMTLKMIHLNTSLTCLLYTSPAREPFADVRPPHRRVWADADLRHRVGRTRLPEMCIRDRYRCYPY